MSNDPHTQLRSHIDGVVHSHSHQSGARRHIRDPCRPPSHCWAGKADGVSAKQQATDIQSLIYRPLDQTIIIHLSIYKDELQLCSSNLIFI